MKIVDLIPLLVTLGRTKDPQTIPAELLPKARDFHVLRNQWDHVVEGWDSAQLADLIKGLTYFETVYNISFGSVTPVANLFPIYASLVDPRDRDDLAEWVLANTTNEYAPFGSNNLGARSLAELREKQSAWASQRRSVAEREQSRADEARSQRTVEATARLANALRRKDEKAVAALLAKGADASVVGPTGLSVLEIARDLGVETWLTSAKQGES